jgi:putative flippase GtrA
MATQATSFMASDTTSLPPLPDPGAPSLGAAPVKQNGLQQLIKFCVVGASSTVVDKGTLWILLNALPLVPWWFCSTISFCFGVTNGFFWNRHWTFRAREHGSARSQYRKFFLSNCIGWLLNLGFTKLFLVLFTGQLTHGNLNPEPRQVLIASLCAVPCVVVWNFSAAKFWTFKAPK